MSQFSRETFSKTYDRHKKILKGKRAILLGEVEALSRLRGYCYAKAEYFVKKLGICKKTLMNYYRDLEEQKMIERVKKGRRTFILLGENFSSSLTPSPLSLPKEENYTFPKVRNTPFSKASRHDSLGFQGCFYEEEKKNKKEQTNSPPLLKFGRKTWCSSEIREEMEILWKERGFLGDKSQFHEEFSKFVQYHLQKGASQFSLRQNLNFWMTYDSEGFFFQERNRQKAQKEKEKQKVKKQEEEKQNEERQQIKKELQEAAPLLQEFFKRARLCESSGGSFLKLWESLEASALPIEEEPLAS